MIDTSALDTDCRVQAMRNYSNAMPPVPGFCSISLAAVAPTIQNNTLGLILSQLFFGYLEIPGLAEDAGNGSKSRRA
jgi:hypothetical protein